MSASARAKDDNHEIRTFKAAPALIFDTIKRQAGTLSKGVLELVMNSADAGATEVHITMDYTTVVVSDDGKGFQKRQQIEDFFETFGTPHARNEAGVSTDARFGTFRIGRGQIFAFSRSVWRSGPFEMDVDVNLCGLEYKLKDNLGLRKGCLITNHLYEPLNAMGLDTLERELEHFVKYLDVPVFIGTKLISAAPKDSKWTLETDEAFIKHSGSSGRLAIFQQGILVEEMWAGTAGIGGVVVTKKPLALNMARNQVVTSCPVWRKIKLELDALAGKSAVKKQKLSAEERVAMLRRLAHEGNIGLSEKELNSIKLLRDSSGIDWSVNQIRKLKAGFSAQPDGRIAVTFDEKGGCVGDRVQQQRKALVLDESILEEVSVKSAEEFYRKILDIRLGLSGALTLCKLKDLSADMTVDYVLLEDSAIPARIKMIMPCIEKILYDARGYKMHIEGIPYQEWTRVRTVRIGTSKVADAWTDGQSYIAFELKNLSRFNVFDEAAWQDIALLIIHEMCHDTDSHGTHEHSPEFYRQYHDMSRRAADWARAAYMQYIARVDRAAMKLPEKIRKAILLRKKLVENADLLEQARAELISA